jgi:hypothetical protein
MTLTGPPQFQHRGSASDGAQPGPEFADVMPAERVFATGAAFFE